MPNSTTTAGDTALTGDIPRRGQRRGEERRDARVGEIRQEHNQHQIRRDHHRPFSKRQSVNQALFRQFTSVILSPTCLGTMSSPCSRDISEAGMPKPEPR